MACRPASDLMRRIPINEDDLYAAEDAYAQAILERTPDPCEVVLEHPDGPPGRYRTDSGWPDKPRELAIERQRIMWAVDAGGWLPPTRAMVRAVGRLIGPGRVISDTMGTDPRTWRRWVSDPDSMSWADWRVLCELAGIEVPDIAVAGRG